MIGGILLPPLLYLYAGCFTTRSVQKTLGGHRSSAVWRRTLAEEADKYCVDLGKRMRREVGLHLH